MIGQARAAAPAYCSSPMANTPALPNPAEPSIRRRIGEELPLLFSDIGGDTASLTQLYDAAERRYGRLLDRRPDPARATQQKWQHDLRWELQSAVDDGRVLKRTDVGRAVYSVASGRPPSPPFADAVLTVPALHDIERWKSFDEVYAPGRGRPRALHPGSHLWLRHRGRLVWRFEVVGVERRGSRVSSMDGRDLGPGWSILVGVGEEVEVTDRDLGVTDRQWGRGLRYLDPLSMRVAGAARPARITPEARIAEVESTSTEPVIALRTAASTVWRRIEADLVADWIVWCADAGRSVKRLVLRTDEGVTLKTDAFDETTRLLVEAKGSTSREHVRMAIGQLLDYWQLAHAHARQRAILLPRQPAPSLVRLVLELDIGLIFRDGSGFNEQLPPSR